MVIGRRVCIKHEAAAALGLMPLAPGRLLSSFQTTLDEITLIALPQQHAPAAKAVQIHSYVDPAKGTPVLSVFRH